MTRRRSLHRFLVDLFDGLLRAAGYILAGFVLARIACHFGFGLP